MLPDADCGPKKTEFDCLSYTKYEESASSKDEFQLEKSARKSETERPNEVTIIQIERTGLSKLDIL